ncbi:MAG: hypothetical protein L0Y57_09235 [Beijerinckiaceae bacterium]|nr:hypothetical protein [Beijerinckiaceae bacterium]
MKRPGLRLIRIPVGVLLLAGGLIGFLPLVGFWMVPLGLAVLAIDFPIAGRMLRKLKELFFRLRRFGRRRIDRPGL